MFRLFKDLFSRKPRVYNIVWIRNGVYYTTDGVEWYRHKVPLTFLKTLILYTRFYIWNKDVYIQRDNSTPKGKALGI